MDINKHEKLKPLTAEEFKKFQSHVRQNLSDSCHTPEMVVRLVKTIESVLARGKVLPNIGDDDPESAREREVTGIVSASDPNDIMVTYTPDKLYAIRILKFYRHRLENIEETAPKIHELDHAIAVLEKMPKAKPQLWLGRWKARLVNKGFDVEGIVKELYPSRPAWADLPTNEKRQGAVADFEYFRKRLGIRRDIAQFAISIQAYGCYNAVGHFHKFGKRVNTISPDAVAPLIEKLYGNKRPDWIDGELSIRNKSLSEEYDWLIYKRGMMHATARKVLSGISGLAESTVVGLIRHYRWLDRKVQRFMARDPATNLLRLVPKEEKIHMRGRFGLGAAGTPRKAFLAAGGLTIPPSILRDAVDGKLTYSQAAVKAGCSTATINRNIRKLRTKLGLKLRHPAFSDAEMEQLACFCKMRLSVNKIRKSLGCSPVKVGAAMRRLGFKYPWEKRPGMGGRPKTIIERDIRSNSQQT